MKKINQRAIKSELSSIHKPDDMTLEEWQAGLRAQAARKERFRLRNTGGHPIFSDFSVSNPVTGGEYRVSIRGDRSGVNYCSCPDYAINTLGTCKHIEAVLRRLRRNKRQRGLLLAPFSPAFSEVYLRYGAKRELVFALGKNAPRKMMEHAKTFFDQTGVLTKTGAIRFEDFLKTGRKIEPSLTVYDDALQFVAEWRDALHRMQTINDTYGAIGELVDAKKTELPGVKTSLYPYQYEGAIFAARAGRSIIADEMGLGKTIQAIAAAEIMARHFGVERALIVCPTSLKYQWKQEIDKFCDRDASIVEGQFHARLRCYEAATFYTIANYEQIFRDLKWIRRIQWDLIILDETQRIKNWKTRTSQAVKSLQSQYAIALTGTPLENRLEELHSIVSFIDRFKLGPLFRFLDRHQVTENGSGKVTGYRNLSSIGETLSPILLRRTKKQVLTQLPERLDKNFFVPMTSEQMAIHQDNANVVAQVVARWKKIRHLSESDRKKLMVALQYMRMSCDSTYLVDKGDHHGPKIDELTAFLGDLLQSEGEKAVVFSQWHRMHELVENVLKKNKIGYVFLHGGVPAKERGTLVDVFKNDQSVRVFLSTDAGGTGLNLQNASTVVNLDVPWNPAVLEQRIGRVHRLGQKRPVRVINFVAEGTIEHGMLNVLAFKRSLFAGVLDGGEDAVFMGESRLNRFMKDVEKVAGEIPAVAADPAVLPQPLSGQETIATGDDSPAVLTKEYPPNGTAGVSASRVDSFQKLLEHGADFLRGLAASLASGENGQASSLVEKDPVSGRQYLKVPMPEEATITALLAKVASIVGGNK